MDAVIIVFIILLLTILIKESHELEEALVTLFRAHVAVIDECEVKDLHDAVSLLPACHGRALDEIDQAVDLWVVVKVLEDGQ